jgi:Flp pilus assembly protein TadD
MRLRFDFDFHERSDGNGAAQDAQTWRLFARGGAAAVAASLCRRVLALTPPDAGRYNADAAALLQRSIARERRYESVKPL